MGQKTETVLLWVKHHIRGQKVLEPFTLYTRGVRLKRLLFHIEQTAVGFANTYADVVGNILIV